MAVKHLQENLNWLLIRASMASKQRLMKLADEYDLTIMQALTLCFLEPDMPVPMSMISDLLACDPSNVTGIVERLSVGEYIERRESRTDRRVKTITLTESGVKLREVMLPRITDEDASNLNLTADEVAELKRLLLKGLPVSNATKHLAQTSN